MTSIKGSNPEFLYKNERTVRVISHFKNGNCGCGTGFFIKSSGILLTCWHVICGSDLKDIKKSPGFIQSTKNSESEKIKEYFENVFDNIELELNSGKLIKANLIAYDYLYDLAVLKPKNNNVKYPFFELELNELDYGDKVMSTGFPACLGYDLLKSPFATNFGRVLAFPNVEIAGDKYDMVQISSTCIGGASGSPLFKEDSKRVIGIVNGLEWRGCDNVAVFNNGNFSNTFNLTVPINISYATDFCFLSQKSSVFKEQTK